MEVCYFTDVSANVSHYLKMFRYYMYKYDITWKANIPNTFPILIDLNSLKKGECKQIGM